MNNYSYEADWRPYAFEEQTSRFTSEEELAARYTEVALKSGQTLTAGGLPVVCDGVEAVLNTENEMTMIFGGTASKKTRTLIAPLISILAQARESMVILDIKGELSGGPTFPQIRGNLEANGYDCRFFNLRDMNADAFNILLEPYRLYQSGHRDEAMCMVNDVVDALASIYNGSTADPFWASTAKQYLSACIGLMFELCQQPDMVNMLTLASYTDWDSCEDMRKVSEMIEVDNNIMTMLRSVVSEPDRTRMSTLATVNSMLTNFVTNGKLLRMLSQSTFDLHELYTKPTALFIIMPDEVDTYAGIVGLMLQQISSTLVQDAYKLGGALPNRVNFICDEFCNYYVPGMTRNISAHRSRNIRWYMVCQSLKQLQTCYPKEADTIMANCTNLYFLNSPEMSLLEYLSKRAGYSNITADGSYRPILSVADLQGLKKGWTHTDVYFTSGSIHYVAKMPDISQYAFVSRFHKPCELPTRVFSDPPVYTSKKMCQDLRAMRSAYNSASQLRDPSPFTLKLAKKYENLFKNKAA